MANKHEYVVGSIHGLKKIIDLYRSENGGLMAVTECTRCGRIGHIRARSLYAKGCNSCTCMVETINGESNYPLYGIYSNMKDRCYNSNCHAYHNYGGRGIAICEEWICKNGYNNFAAWARENGYIDGQRLSIDRIDVNGNYCPENCRWITVSKNTSLANSSKRVQHRKADNGSYFALFADGTMIEFENASLFAETYNLKAERIRACARRSLTNGAQNYNGIMFGYIKILNVESQSTIENPN